jgi:hypothetical protein
MDLQAARQFVSERGGQVDRLEFSQLCLGEDCRAPLLDEYTARQNPDGGFGGLGRMSWYASDVSSMLATLRWLRQLVLLGLGDSQPARSAAAFIAGCQGDDGGFRESPAAEAACLPDWAKPGRAQTVQRLTAAACWLLPQIDGSLQAAADAGLALIERIWHDHQGFLGDSHEPYVEGLGLFGRRGGVESPRFLACVEHLLGYWDSLPFWHLPRIVETAVAVGLAADRPFLKRCRVKIDNAQMSDGSWTDGFSLRRSPQVTVLACHAMRLLDTAS